MTENPINDMQNNALEIKVVKVPKIVRKTLGVMRRLVKPFLILLVVAIIGLLIFNAMLDREIAQLTAEIDKEYAAHIAHLKEKDKDGNPFREFMFRLEKMQLGRIETPVNAPYGPWDDSWTAQAEMLRQNATLLGEAKQVLKQPKGGVWVEDYSSVIPGLVNIYRICQLLMLEALQKEYQGDPDFASQQMFLIMELGPKVTEDGGFIQMSSSLSYYGISLKGMSNIIHRQKFSEEKLISLSKRLANEYKRMPPLSKTIIIEKIAQKKFILDILDNKNRDKYQEIVLEYMGTDRTSSSLPIYSKWKLLKNYLTYQEQLDAFISITSTSSINNVKLKDWGTKFKINEMPLVLSSLRSLALYYTQVQSQFKATQLICALEAYRAKNNFYPERLEDLIPEYLEQLPNDSINDKSFIYQKTNDDYRLYSLGKNGKDEGGENGDDHLFTGWNRPRKPFSPQKNKK